MKKNGFFTTETRRLRGIARDLKEYNSLCLRASVVKNIMTAKEPDSCTFDKLLLGGAEQMQKRRERGGIHAQVPEEFRKKIIIKAQGIVRPDDDYAAFFSCISSAPSCGYCI